MTLIVPHSVASDVARENKDTRSAVIIGLLCGAAMYIAVFSLALSGRWKLYEVLLSTIWIPGILTFVMMWVRDWGYAWLAEVIGYAGSAYSIVPVTLHISWASGPLLILSALYDDQGRYAMAAKIRSLIPMSLSDNSRLMCEFLLVFRLGNYEQAVEYAERLQRQTDEKYRRQPSEKNLDLLLMAQSNIARMFWQMGRRDQALKIWARLKALPEFSASFSPRAAAYDYDSMAECAAALGDSTAGLHYATLSRQNIQRSKHFSKLLTGDVAADFAAAYLGLNELDKAEEEAQRALSDWRTFLNPTAGLLARAYFLLARVQMARHNFRQAAHFFEHAVAIEEGREAPHYPGSLDALELYSQCLQELNRPEQLATIQARIAQIRQFHHLEPPAIAPDAPAVLKLKQPEHAESD